MAQKEFTSDQLREIVRRFRPIVGEEKHAGNYRGSFYVGRIRDERAVTTAMVKELLVAAGVKEENIIIEPSGYRDELRWNSSREDMIISSQDFELLEKHVATLNLSHGKNVPEAPAR